MSVNVLLLALFLSELALIWLAHKTVLQGVVEALAPIAVVGGVMVALAKYVQKLFDAEAKQWQRNTLQSWRAALVLGALASSLSPFAVTSFLMILWPGPLLCILPAPSLFNRITEAVPGQGVSYELRVKRGDTLITEGDVTGAGSIYLAANPQRRIRQIGEDALGDELENRAREHLGSDFDKAEFLPAWRNADPEQRKFLRARLREGTRLLFELRCTESRRVLTAQTVFVGGRASPQVEFLEDASAEQGCSP